MPVTDKVTLKIEGMHCAGCVRNIEQGVKTLAGVEESRVNLATGSAVVVFQKDKIDREGIIRHITKLGYKALPGTPDVMISNDRELETNRKNFYLAAGLSVPLMVLAMWPMLADGFIHSFRIDGLVQAILAGGVLVAAGRGIIGDAFRQARHLKANMNSLITLGTLTAFSWSLYLLITVASGDAEPFYFDSVGMIITLILLGRWLEARSRGKAGEAIRALLNLRPSKTTLILNDVEREIETTMVRPGMVLLIKAGERVAADGEVVENNPSLDESMLTGEAVPVEKKVGDKVIGGSLNNNIPFKMKVTATGQESFLAQVIKLVTEAQEKKAPVQKLADRVAGIFVPIVIILAAITFSVWYWLAPDSPMLIKSVVSVLIIACPCALGLATPTAILAGTGRAAREGIIIRGGDILEKLAKINMVVFDKTGTLTYGELEVTGIKAFGTLSEKEILRLAASVECQSEHPLAEAIVRSWENSSSKKLPVDNVQTRPGYGMVAHYDGHLVVIGNKALMESENVRFGLSLAEAELEMEQGKTVVFVALDNSVQGIISLADRLRGDAREIIDNLKRAHLQLTMLSGDNRLTARGVAGFLGLDHYEAEIKPEQKKVMVESFRKAGYQVAMVGDGINDAPALAVADVGIAIGSGTDVAIEAADVILVGSSLMDLKKMFDLSHFSMRIIKQNLFWAFIYNIIALPVAGGLLYPLFGLTLTPMLAALAMSFSSVFVVTNALRLNRLEL